MFTPAISPIDSKLMMLNCDMGAAYLTRDGGKTWRMLPYSELRSSTKCRPAFHPHDVRTIYAANGWDGIKVSHDQGEHWAPLGELPGGEAQGEIAIDPQNPHLLLVGSDKGVCRSENAGASWGLCRGPVGKPIAFHFDVTSEANGTCFVATTEGIWASKDGGKSWAPATSGLPSQEILWFAGGSNAQTGETKLYCSVRSELLNGKLSGGVYRSTDRGDSWQPVDGSGLNRDTQAFDQWAHSPIAQYVQVLTTNANPSVVYALNSSTGIPPPHHATVFRSDDAGRSWRSVFQADPRWKPCTVEAGFVVEEDRQYYASVPLGAAISQTNADTLLVVNEGECLITTDGGSAWKNGACHRAPSNGEQDAKPRWTCNGLVVTSTWNFYVDPFESDRRYICYTDIGLGLSTDRGASWRWWPREGRSPWRNTCYELAFDPAVKGKMWGAFSDVHDIPNANIISGRHRDRGAGGVCVSTDFGETWKPTTQGLPRAPVISVVVDPASPVGSRTLYAGVFGFGVYRSTDDGATWTAANKGIGSEANRRVCRVALHSDGTLFALVTALQSKGKFTAEGAGLYVSKDRGESWRCLNAGQPLLWPKDFSVDPSNSSRILLGAADAGSEKQGGLYQTLDGGVTWSRIAREGPEHFGAFFHPTRPGWIYMTLCEGAPGSGLWLSRDDGCTWKPMNGLPFPNAQRVAFDPGDPGAITVTTFGGGVWRGPESE